jgi:hypothetical protein
MNNDSIDYLNLTLQDSEILIEDLQCYFISNKVSNEKTLIFLSIISDYFENNNKIESLLNIIKNYIKDYSVYIELEKILKDHVEEIKNINKEVEKNNLNTVKLIDIEWKFIGSASLEKAENQIFEPRILLKLIYSNGTTQIIETDFANFKKLQEEFELAASSYNSAYSRKLTVFSK